MKRKTSTIKLGSTKTPRVQKKERELQQKKFTPSEVPLFFGQQSDILRLDLLAYPFFEQQLNRGLSCFWIPEEIDLSQDKSDFNKLPAHVQNLYKRNLQYQSLLDTVVSRDFTTLFLPHASNNELQSYIQWHGFSEMIHSKSYTHILRTVFDDPSPVFDEVLDIPSIAKRAESINKYLDAFAENPCMDTLYLACHQVNSLEGLRFYVSFACSFAIAESLGSMRSSAQIIKMIARDEVIHMVTFQKLIKTLDMEYPELARKHEEEVYDMYLEVVEEECEWADYLLPESASMLGLNANLLKDYVKYLSNLRLKSVGKLPMYDVKKNPLPWINKYLNSDSIQSAPQEIESVQYLSGATDGKLDIPKFSSFEL